MISERRPTLTIACIFVLVLDLIIASCFVFNRHPKQEEITVTSVDMVQFLQSFGLGNVSLQHRGTHRRYPSSEIHGDVSDDISISIITHVAKNSELVISSSLDIYMNGRMVLSDSSTGSVLLFYENGSIRAMEHGIKSYYYDAKRKIGFSDRELTILKYLINHAK